MVTRHILRRRVRTALSSVEAAVLFLGLSIPALHAQRRVVAARMIDTINEVVDATDTGAMPVSQPMHLTLRLAPTPERQAALDQLLSAQTTPSSPTYHRWLTPQQFAATYGATDEQITATTTWLQSQGMTVDGVSRTKTRIIASGTADQVQRAFAVSLRSYSVSGTQHYASAGLPTMPQEVSSTIAEVSGLDDLPPTAKTRVAAISPNGLTTLLSSDGTNALDAASAAIDANTSPILSLATSDCSASLNQADYEAYRALFRQASAQGITVVTSTTCDSQSVGAQIGDLAEATALITAPAASPLAATDPRPGWQSAPGLPDDSLRHAPDLTTTSIEDFTNALTTILQQSDDRQGNINATLYSLASTPDLYTQPDGASGTWESATGLGTVDLKTLVKVFPRASGSISTTTSLTADQYAVGYGAPITLKSTITPSSYATAGPTGVITFTSASGTIGSAQLNNGNASFTVSNLVVGTYAVTANYSGDGSYAPSTSTSSVVITVSIVNASLTATIAPQKDVPYGSTATVTATVALPNSSAAPSGTVSAQIQGITGALYSATLSPNPGGNTATANINIDAPPPQTPATYTVQTTCTGNQNFQCQTPVNLTFTTAKGNTTTTLSLTPAAPQAGQPVTLTATINNNGNGKLTYNFSGNVTFYDNGTLIATAPVATNVATISKTLSGNVQHSIVAKYAGDANWNASTSVPQAVQPTLLPSTLTLTSNSTTTLAGVNLVFTATVFTTATNSVGPTGSVTFYDTFNGSVVQLGSPTPLTPNGPNQSIAIFTTTGLLAGTHSVYAIYSGDANFNTATASTLAITLADFTLTNVPQTLTLKAGQNGKVVMLLGMVGGFNGTVTFGCSPPSNAEATCSFNPVTLTGGGSTTLQITTTAAVLSTSTTTQKAQLDSRWNLFGGAALAGLFWLAVPRRRLGLSRLALLIAAVCLTANIGCGTGKTATTDPTPTVTDPGTPLGTQVFTITAAGNDGTNSVRHTYQYQVTIQ
jgi:hypothetical protein